MTWNFHQSFKKLLSYSFSFLLGLMLLVLPFGQGLLAAKQPSMSGDFAKDTISVAQSLKGTIALADDDETLSESKDEALGLITAYISRYRNRPNLNSTSSFTTMQTALNAMAGHYKTFSNRPLPENLKERLNKELTRAEKIVVKEV